MLAQHVNSLATWLSICSRVQDLDELVCGLAGTTARQGGSSAVCVYLGRFVREALYR